MIQILNVTLYNLRSIPFPTLFLSILLLNITDIILPISLLSKPIPRNAGSAGNKFVSHDKKFIGKIDTNVASWHLFLLQIFANKLTIDSIVTVMLFWKTKMAWCCSVDARLKGMAKSRDNWNGFSQLFNRM